MKKLGGEPLRLAVACLESEWNRILPITTL
jgi:hypothetical protein